MPVCKQGKLPQQQSFKLNMHLSTVQQLYKEVPQLRISPEGQFKYILIKCKVGNEVATFIRGDKKFSYHSDNYDQFYKELKKSGFDQLKKNEEKISGIKQGQKFEFFCVGGGRIEHNYMGVICSIYGYSQSYGYVDHEVAQKIISQHLGYPLIQILLDQKDY